MTDDLMKRAREIHRAMMQAPVEAGASQGQIDRAQTAVLHALLVEVQEAAEAKQRGTESFDIVFDGPPSPEGPRFIETELLCGRSFRAGEWIDRGDGTYALRVPGTAEAEQRGRKAYRDEMLLALGLYAKGLDVPQLDDTLPGKVVAYLVAGNRQARAQALDDALEVCELAVTRAREPVGADQGDADQLLHAVVLETAQATLSEIAAALRALKDAPQARHIAPLRPEDAHWNDEPEQPAAECVRRNYDDESGVRLAQCVTHNVEVYAADWDARPCKGDA